MNDKASGVFNTAYAIGCTIGPVLGGLLNDNVGFRYTCDIMACSSLTFAVIYFLFNVLPSILSKSDGKPHVLLVEEDQLTFNKDNESVIENRVTAITVADKH